MSGDNVQNTPPEQTAEQYFEELRRWLDEARAWHSLYTTNYAQIHQSFPITVQQPNLRAFKEYVIPPLWKRMIAETVDFLILFAIKICLLVLILEVCMTLKLEAYVLDTVKQYPSVAIQIAAIEVLQGIIALVYESYWLSSESCATPGKRYMGLMVINAEHFYPSPNQNQIGSASILVYPSTRLTVKKAFTRSVVKHIFFTFMIPMYYIWTLLEYNRLGYDLFTNTMVVEHNPNPRVHFLR